MAGRFKKGETPKGAIPISEGTAKEMQARSVQSHYAKKRGKELMLAILGERTKDPTVVASMRAAGYNPDEITNELALHLRQGGKPLYTRAAQIRQLPQRRTLPVYGGGI